MRYEIEVEREGCRRCGVGEQWMVIDRSRDCGIGGTTFSEREEAEHLAELLNAADAAAAEDLRAILRSGQRKLETYVNIYPCDKELRRLLADWKLAVGPGSAQEER